MDENDLKALRVVVKLLRAYGPIHTSELASDFVERAKDNLAINTCNEIVGVKMPGCTSIPGGK